MAVKREIRTTLALDGENEYKKALSEAQRANLADFAQFFCTSLVAAARV